MLWNSVTRWGKDGRTSYGTHTASGCEQPFAPKELKRLEEEEQSEWKSEASIQKNEHD